jgi:hypothetical protein
MWLPRLVIEIVEFDITVAESSRGWLHPPKQRFFDDGYSPEGPISAAELN